MSTLFADTNLPPVVSVGRSIDTVSVNTTDTNPNLPPRLVPICQMDVDEPKSSTFTLVTEGDKRRQKKRKRR